MRRDDDSRPSVEIGLDLFYPATCIDSLDAGIAPQDQNDKWETRYVEPWFEIWRPRIATGFRAYRVRLERSGPWARVVECLAAGEMLEFFGTDLEKQRRIVTFVLDANAGETGRQWMDEFGGFRVVLDDHQRLVDALRAIELTAKQRADLSQLYWSPKGVPVIRDSGRRVRGDTVQTCSAIGAILTRYFDGVGPKDQMMWIGLLSSDPQWTERWKMRDPIRKALATVLGFQSQPIASNVPFCESEEQGYVPNWVVPETPPLPT